MKLVLWDIDGTLVNTAGYGRNAFGEAFTAVFDRPADLSGIDMGGRTDRAISLMVLEAGGITDGTAHVDPMLAALATSLEAMRERIAEEGHPTPGAHETLEAIGARNDMTQTMLTGNIEVNAALKLAAFGLDGLIDLEIGAYGSDPHEERSDLVAVAREKAARMRGIEVGPADVILIGDTPRDVDAAHGAGARAIGVAGSSYSPAQLLEAGAEAAFEDLRDVRGLIAAIAA